MGHSKPLFYVKQDSIMQHEALARDLLTENMRMEISIFSATTALVLARPVVFKRKSENPVAGASRLFLLRSSSSYKTC